MSRSKKLRFYIQIIVAVAVIIGAYFVKLRTEEKEDILRKHGRYTVGETTGWGKNIRSSNYFIKYKYKVNGWSFEKSMTVDNLKDFITSEGRYIVCFLPQKPTESEILIDMPVVYVPYYVGTDSGWKEVPDFVLHFKRDTVQKR